MTEPEFLAAVTTGDEAAARAALTANPVLADAKASDGTTVSLMALYHGQKALAQAIGELRHETLSIFEAAALGRIRDVSVLLHLHRDRASEVSPDGFTALQLACFFGHPPIVHRLLDAGADLHAVARNGMRIQPLHAAVAARKLEIVQMLVAAGADVNATQQDNFTPLMGALQNGDSEIETLLRKAGAVA